MWTKSRSRRKLQALRDTDMDWPRHFPSSPMGKQELHPVDGGHEKGGWGSCAMRCQSPFAELGSWERRWCQVVGMAWHGCVLRSCRAVCALWTMSCGLVSCRLDTAEPPLCHIWLHLPILLFSFPLFSTFWKSSDPHGEMLLSNVSYTANLISADGFSPVSGSTRDGHWELTPCPKGWLVMPAFADSRPFNLCLRTSWPDTSQPSNLIQCFAVLSCRKIFSPNIRSVFSLLWFKLISSQLIHHKHGNQVPPSILVGKPSMHLKLITCPSCSFFQLNSPSSFSLFPLVSQAVFVFLWTCCSWLCCVTPS